MSANMGMIFTALKKIKDLTERVEKLEAAVAENEQALTGPSARDIISSQVELFKKNKKG